MKPTPLIAALLAFAAAGGLSVLAARLAVTQIEAQSAEDVRLALQEDGQDWVEVTADGLQLALLGTAADEATRFRALSLAGTIVDPARVIDSMQVSEAEPVVPPDFSIEILRGDEGISLIGLAPARTDRAGLLAALGRIEGTPQITDLLEIADFPEPKGWRKAVEFGVAATSRLPRVKVSVTDERIGVLSMAESAEDQRRIEAELRRMAPDGFETVLRIGAPRPVITPFTLRFVIDEAGARFDACSADSAEGRRRIVAAATAAGMGEAGAEDCRIGIGAPSPEWPAAAVQSIEALAAIGAGTVTMSDVDISLIAAEGSDAETFERAAGRLDGALPEEFSLDAVLPEVENAEPRDAGVPQFEAVRAADGTVVLRGRVGDDRSRGVVRSFAKSLFGIEAVTDATRGDAGLPTGWSPRLLAALDAMSLLGEGRVVVRPDVIEIGGVTGQKDARAEIARILTAQLGENGNYTIAVSYDEALDPVASLPSPEECAASINAVLDARQITFAPGSDTIDAEARGTLEQIAELMKSCDSVPMEIGGHTDSQGRETMNLELSRSRAEAVLAALAARRVLIGNLSAKGYGEAQPVADNGTAEGREANRRIEFKRILSDEERAAAEAQAADDEGAGDGTDEEAANDGQETEDNQ
ncbi:OmpA family protein [Profundibacterium mesophilum]|uniref:Outer membrane protein OmpA family protein n=1 Tax=Profundibacterium mesophilum KAUST100406-0324 TaxID=1037889 RepID=A0A921NYT2_9RHOB|nr:OmpA family protein [Profundibacterium mesophilum]KAF0675983.1 putative outer membrane protein OmpA family protein [Profundibacterium mesophilum KAUST100406-0324]